VIFKFATKHHAPTRHVNRWRLNGVVIQAPNHVAHSALIIQVHGKMGMRSRVKILSPEMIGGLVSST
jgi:hypothetical protein